MSTALRASLLLVACIVATSVAHAQDAASLRARSLAATCAQCHGTDGRAAEPGRTAVPPLAGMPADTLVAQMNAFKTGTRNGTVMPQIAKGFNDAQIAQLAAWFATAAKSP